MSPYLPCLPCLPGPFYLPTPPLLSLTILHSLLILFLCTLPRSIVLTFSQVSCLLPFLIFLFYILFLPYPFPLPLPSISCVCPRLPGRLACTATLENPVDSYAHIRSYIHASRYTYILPHTHTLSPIKPTISFIHRPSRLALSAFLHGSNTGRHPSKPHQTSARICNSGVALATGLPQDGHSFDAPAYPLV